MKAVWGFVFIMVLLCAPVLRAQDLRVFENEQRDEWMQWVMRGRPSLQFDDIDARDKHRDQEGFTPPSNVPDWEQMAREAFGFSMELSSLIQHLSEQQTKDGHPNEPPGQLILRYVANAFISSLFALPQTKDLLPKNVHPDIDIGTDAAGYNYAQGLLRFDFDTAPSTKHQNDARP